MDAQSQDDRNSQLRQKNAKTARMVFLIVACMVGLSFASVPLYDLFCRVTGFGGTTQVSEALPDQILERAVTIRFDANTAQNLPWEFRPEVLQTSVKLGEKGLTNYIAMNQARAPVTGTALYNVTPLKAGKYFHKIQCFCFNEQVLQPNEKINMPVMFYVDPKMADDPLMDDVTTITLSYSFFKIDTPELDQAWEAFYNSQPDDAPASAVQTQ
jgi:cytochrome c oxidase assembly protein subunit 11